MTPPKVLDFLATSRGHSDLRKVEVLMLQEIIVDAGIKFDEGEGWVLVSGKKEDEWRGVALAFRDTFSHSHATVHPRAISLTLSRKGHKLGAICGHIPRPGNRSSARRLGTFSNLDTTSHCGWCGRQ